MHFRPFIFLFFCLFQFFFCFIFLVLLTCSIDRVKSFNIVVRSMLRVLVSLLLFGDCHGTYLLAYLLVRHLVCSSPVLRFVVVPSWCVRIVLYDILALCHPWRSYGIFVSFELCVSRRSIRSVYSPSFRFVVCDFRFFFLFFFLSFVSSFCCGP